MIKNAPIINKFSTKLNKLFLSFFMLKGLKFIYYKFNLLKDKKRRKSNKVKSTLRFLFWSTYNIFRDQNKNLIKEFTLLVDYQNLIYNNLLHFKYVKSNKYMYILNFELYIEFMLNTSKFLKEFTLILNYIIFKNFNVFNIKVNSMFLKSSLRVFFFYKIKKYIFFNFIKKEYSIFIVRRNKSIFLNILNNSNIFKNIDLFLRTISPNNIYNFIKIKYKEISSKKKFIFIKKNIYKTILSYDRIVFLGFFFIIYFLDFFILYLNKVIFILWIRMIFIICIHNEGILNNFITNFIYYFRNKVSNKIKLSTIHFHIVKNHLFLTIDSFLRSSWFNPIIVKSNYYAGNYLTEWVRLSKFNEKNCFSYEKQF